MNRRTLLVVVAVASVLVVAGAVVWKVVGDGDWPGWEKAGELDDIIPEEFVVGVGNDEVSIVPATEMGEDANQRGVAVTDNETGDITFAHIAGTDNGCSVSPRVTVGPAGFVYSSIGLNDGECPDGSGRFVAVSTDGSEWEPAPNFDGVENSTVFAGSDRFLRISDGNVVDALTDDDVTAVPWDDDFSVNAAAASSEGEIVVFRRFMADDDSEPIENVGWAMSAEGEWSPIEPLPAWRSFGAALSFELNFGVIQPSSDGGFRLVSNATASTLVSRSDDGITWTVDDTGAGVRSFLPDMQVLYSSPDRTLFDLSTSTSDPFAQPFCFAVTEPCELPDELFIEVTDDGIVELRSDDYQPSEYAPFASVDDDGFYTQLSGRDSPIEIRRMTERDEGDLGERFDRRPSDFATTADEIGSEQVDLLGEVTDGGESLVLLDSTTLSQVEPGAADIGDLRVENPADGIDSTEYAMFTAERDGDDRIVVYAYPTGDVFGTYDIDQ